MIKKRDKNLKNDKKSFGTLGEQVEFDFVVVGAGSAGCVLANRLSANPNTGSRCWKLAAATDRLGYTSPSVISNNGNPKTDWCYQTQPDPGLMGAQSPGHGQGAWRQQFDQWASLCAGRRRILIIGDSSAIKAGAGTMCYRCSNAQKIGKVLKARTAAQWTTQCIRKQSCPRYCRCVVDAAEQAGYPNNNDYNSEARRRRLFSDDGAQRQTLQFSHSLS